ncbi:MAG TPA: nuclear transport factor 2 family protein [Acidimicrobiia bacterium]|jgi:ketosteroid isomerase-like protein|nr:nuclear transport factor 2 family protein [Acidimicrobiia bacterium]
MTIDEVRDELERLYLEWFERVGGDPGDFFDRVLSDDWVYIDYNGAVRGKPGYADYIKPVPPARAPRRPRELQVRTFGDLAIVHGAYEVPGGGTDPDRTLRFTAVWIDRDSMWRCLAHHTSAVGDPVS